MTKTNAAMPNTAQSTEIADYVRGMATDLERLTHEADLETVAVAFVQRLLKRDVPSAMII